MGSMKTRSVINIIENATAIRQQPTGSGMVNVCSINGEYGRLGSVCLDVAGVCAVGLPDSYCKKKLR